MTPVELDNILNLILRYGFEGMVAGSIVFLLLKNFLPGYLSQKGKNLATQEDIKKITEKVESVKSDYAKIIEEIKSNNQIKISAIEREKSTKKEVYMEAAEALMKAQNMVARFSNLNISDEVITADFSLEAGKIAKVQIVGTGETVKAVTTIMSAIGEATLSLILGRGSLIQRKNLIEINENERNKCHAEAVRYISIMENLKLEGNTDKNILNIVNRSIDYQNKQIDKYKLEINLLRENQNKEHLIYAQRCMDTFFKISSLIPKAVLAVRKELDFEISESEYIDIYNESIKKGQKVFSDFLKQVE